MSARRPDERLQSSEGNEETTTSHYDDGEEPHGKSLSKTTPPESPQKSRTDLRKRSPATNDGASQDEFAARSAESQVELIAVPAVDLDHLRDGYYRDLRALLPPPDPRLAADEGRTAVDGMLRKIHDAVDQIDRALQPALLLLHRPNDSNSRPRSDGSSSCGRPSGGPSENVRKLPYKSRRRKPDDDVVARVRMKTYRVGTTDDWTVAGMVELNAGDADSAESSGRHADVVSSVAATCSRHPTRFSSCDQQQ